MRLRAGAGRGGPGFLGEPGAASAPAPTPAPPLLRAANGACVWVLFLVLRIVGAHALVLELALGLWRGGAGVPAPAAAAPQLAVQAVMLALFNVWFFKITRGILGVLAAFAGGDATRAQQIMGRKRDE